MRCLRLQFCFAALGSLAISLPLLTRAVDKSGVSPQTISLPSGPGSIEGLGESFEPQLNSGTFSYHVPLKLPPIRGGAPALVLEYSSGAGNGPLGLGWQLKLPCVRRQTDKGLPRYIADDLYIDENAEELVALADGSYRQKIESTFIRYERATNNAWLGRLRNGGTLLFGEAPTHRLDWSTNGTYAWMLSSAQDPNGNRAEYQYLQDGQQIYPAEIRYGLHAALPSEFFRVVFGYETNRPDPFVDCRARFASTNRLRLASVTVFLGERRVRHWRLDYHTNAPVSLLASIAMFGDERSQTNELAEANRDFLPPIRFDYSTISLSNGWQVNTIQLADAVDFHANLAELADVNHDGLPDLVLEQNGGFFSVLNPGPGRPWPPSRQIENVPVVTGLSLAKATTRFVDVRGDGRARLLVPQAEAPDGTATAFFACDFINSTLLAAPTDFTVTGQFLLNDPSVQLVDLNNDKAMDLLRLDAGQFGGVGVLLNGQANGQSNTLVLADAPRADLSFQNGWRLADMNGDRMQDLVLLQDTDSTLVCLNTGLGQFEPAYVMAGGPARDVMLQGSGPLLADLDQDGLTDLVVVNNGFVQVWLNVAGRQWSGPILMQGDQIPDFSGNTTAIRFADLNGNGSTDIVWTEAGSSVLRFLDVNPGNKAWLLTSVTNTLGASASIAYRTSTDFMLGAAAASNAWSVVTPFPVPVVAEIVEGDGLGNRYTNQFTYRNAYYDGLEREFRGFEQAEKRELGDDSQGAPTLVTRFGFDTGATNEALKGKPLRVETVNESGGVFYRQTNHWLPRTLALAVASNETRFITFTFQDAKRTEEIELGAEADAVTLEEEFGYDDYGNQIRHADYGRVENGDRSAWNDEREVIRRFSASFPSGTNLWLLDRLVQEEIQDANDRVFARSQRFYDDETFSGNNLGAVTKGNLTMVREWFDLTNDLFRATSRQEYDPFGNVTGSYDPLGVPGHRELGHFRRMEFDDHIHTHPVRETIFTANPDAKAAGESEPALTIAADYDLGLGVLQRATDFNTNTTTFAFDTFGRLAEITKPYDSTNLPTAQFRYVLQQPLGGQSVNWIETRLRETAGEPGTFDARSYFDGLGRKLMTRTESETNGAVVVTDAVAFNARRGAWKTILPYFESGTLDFSPPVLGHAFVETHYDALGRSRLVFQPLTPDDATRPFSQTIYSPLARRVQDEEQTKPDSPHAGAAMRYVEDGLRDKDGKGRLRFVQEIVKLTDDGLPSATTNTWTTAYRYDVLDNFLGYTDSQNNQKEFRYDALSRKTFMNDPDRGLMRWEYDAASNLRATVDAKSQRIEFAHDGANRLLTENYLDGKPPPPWRFPLPLGGGEGEGEGATNDVVHHYDLPRTNLDAGDTTAVTARNTRGLLAWVEDLSGEEHTSYDARGRVEFVVKRIPDPQFLSRAAGGGVVMAVPLVSYKTAFAYDSLDRVTTLTYPDNDAIAYHYNDRNLLREITGGVNGLTRTGRVIENISYRASGQLEGIDYGNGVVTRYDYDPRLRLTQLGTLNSELGTDLINFAYTFDGVSNIKQIADNRPDSVVPAGDARRNTQVYSYDDLYRITQAQYSFNPPTQPLRNDGHVDYRYDRIGNMLAQISDIVHLEKGLSVTDLGGMSYGGGLGPVGRIGRGPTEAPGPHALTGVANGNRAYPYDANGNMLIVDGLTNSWDFKDRLIACESAEMRAEYTYDYTDRRIMKRVWPKISLSSVGGEGQGEGIRPTSVLYPDKYFEVREYDAPVKYVWNGNTRVARVTGSLSASPRVQRLRLWPGWNLVSLAVSGSPLPLGGGEGQGEGAIAAAFKWNQPALAWSSVATNETLAAGTVLWLRAGTNAVVTLRGAYADPLDRAAPVGASFQPGAGLESWPLTNAAPSDLVMWKFEGEKQSWGVNCDSNFPIGTGFPATLAVSDAIMAQAEALAAMIVPRFSLRIRYYHSDHIGSSGVLTEGGGGLVGETAYYPFGAVRRDSDLLKQAENYRFTRKETDRESGFGYYEARYLASSISRFSSWDPALGESSQELGNPSCLNPYSYALGNPVKWIDSSGRDVTSSVSLTAASLIVPEVAIAKKVYDWGSLLGPLVADSFAAWHDHNVSQRVKDPVARQILQQDVTRQIKTVATQGAVKIGTEVGAGMLGKYAGKGFEKTAAWLLKSDLVKRLNAEGFRQGIGTATQIGLEAGQMGGKVANSLTKSTIKQGLEYLRQSGDQGQDSSQQQYKIPASVSPEGWKPDLQDFKEGNIVTPQ